MDKNKPIDIIIRIQALIHLESAAIAPQTSVLIETLREACQEIERLRSEKNDG